MADPASNVPGKPPSDTNNVSKVSDPSAQLGRAFDRKPEPSAVAKPRQPATQSTTPSSADSSDMSIQIIKQTDEYTVTYNPRTKKYTTRQKSHLPPGLKPDPLPASLQSWGQGYAKDRHTHPPVITTFNEAAANQAEGTTKQSSQQPQKPAAPVRIFDLSERMPYLNASMAEASSTQQKPVAPVRKFDFRDRMPFLNATSGGPRQREQVEHSPLPGTKMNCDQHSSASSMRQSGTNSSQEAKTIPSDTTPVAHSNIVGLLAQHGVVVHPPKPADKSALDHPSDEDNDFAVNNKPGNNRRNGKRGNAGDRVVESGANGSGDAKPSSNKGDSNSASNYANGTDTMPSPKHRNNRHHQNHGTANANTIIPNKNDNQNGNGRLNNGRKQGNRHQAENPPNHNGYRSTGSPRLDDGGWGADQVPRPRGRDQWIKNKDLPKPITYHEPDFFDDDLIPEHKSEESSLHGWAPEDFAPVKFPTEAFGVSYELSKNAWDDKFIAAPLDWENRPPHLGDTCRPTEEVHKWLREVEDCWPGKLAASTAFDDVTTTPALRDWIPSTNKEFPTLRMMWWMLKESTIKTIDEDDLYMVKPWWAEFQCPKSEYLQPYIQPEICGIDPNESRVDRMKRENDFGSAQAAQSRKQYEWAKKKDDLERTRKQKLHARGLQDRADCRGTIKPLDRMYMRPARVADLTEIREVYNTYVGWTTCTMETERVTTEWIEKRYKTALDNKLPFLVVFQRGKIMKWNKEKYQEPDELVGMAWAEDYRPPTDEPNSVEIRVYVKEKACRNKFGTCLLDKLMSMLDPNHAERAGYELESDDIDLGVRVDRKVDNVYVNFLYHDDRYLGVGMKMLERCGFEKFDTDYAFVHLNDWSVNMARFVHRVTRD